MEKTYRSILKSISWRATGTICTVLISFLITRKLDFAISIGFIELISKIILYYLHERLWNRITFGRDKTKKPEHRICETSDESIKKTFHQIGRASCRERV